LEVRSRGAKPKNFSVRFAQLSARELPMVWLGPAARAWLAAGAAAALAVTLVACGTTSAHPVTRQAVSITCHKVSAVLSDGPDPAVDPVGYALAQVKPLRQIHAADQQLARVIDQLADAYQKVYSSDNSKAAKHAAAKALASVNHLCPGAAS
jgi:hypothetical protein